MTFTPGKSGNPAGRPVGSRNSASIAMDVLLDADAKAITEKCIELAKSGDSVALRLCMERLVPPRKERAVCFEMPPLEKAADCIPVMAAIMRGVAEGDLTPAEAAALSKILDSYTRAVELADLAERIAKLEQQNGGRA
jgi:hypothetical protein